MINGHHVRMQNDTGSSLSIISTKSWRRIGSSASALSTNPQRIEAYDGHRLHYLCHLKCEILWEKIHCVDVAVIESENEFGLIGRDVNRVDLIQNGSLTDVKVLPALKGDKATNKPKPDGKPVFVDLGKLYLPWKLKWRLNWRNFRHKESLLQSIHEVS